MKFLCVGTLRRSFPFQICWVIVLNGRFSPSSLTLPSNNDFFSLFSSCCSFMLVFIAINVSFSFVIAFEAHRVDYNWHEVLCDVIMLLSMVLLVSSLGFLWISVILLSFRREVLHHLSFRIDCLFLDDQVILHRMNWINLELHVFVCNVRRVKLQDLTGICLFCSAKIVKAMRR